MKYIALIVAGILFINLLVSCNKSTVSALPVDDGDPAIFTDVDIDAAIPSLADEEVNIASLQPQDLSTASLTTQATLADAEGYIFYIEQKSSVNKPWRIFRFDQATDKTTKIYEGKRKIQAVSGSIDGNTLIVSMRQTASNSSDYEIYRLIISPKSTEILTSNNVDDIDASMSADGSRIAWERPRSGVATVYTRMYSSDDQFTEAFFNNSLPQREPSLSGNGQYLVFIRDLANGNDEVVVYDFLFGSYNTC